MTTPAREKLADAKFGAAAYEPAASGLPTVFPREMGPNALEYLRQVVAAGLASDMEQRFCAEMARLHGLKHCLGMPGCTQALFAVMLGLDFEPGDEIIVSPIADY